VNFQRLPRPSLHGWIVTISTDALDRLSHLSMFAKQSPYRCQGLFARSMFLIPENWAFKGFGHRSKSNDAA
jgi:hypothetical protein